MISGMNAGEKLVKAGIIPANCFHVQITFDAHGVVVMETKTYVTEEQFEAIKSVVEEEIIDGNLEVENRLIVGAAK
jgi:hypothetical protein